MALTYRRNTPGSLSVTCQLGILVDAIARRVYCLCDWLDILPLAPS